MANLVIKSALFSALFLSVAFNLSYAQIVFGTAPTDTSAAKAPTQVMSPDDFKSAVAKRSQQMKNNVTQQSDQFMKAPTPSATATPAAPSTTPAGTEMTTTPPEQAGTAAPAQSPTTLPPMQTPATVPAAAPAKQQDVYTGFGPAPAQTNAPRSGSTPRPAAPSNSGSSGGWNIKY